MVQLHIESRRLRSANPDQLEVPSCRKRLTPSKWLRPDTRIFWQADRIIGINNDLVIIVIVLSVFAIAIGFVLFPLTGFFFLELFLGVLIWR